MFFVENFCKVKHPKAGIIPFRLFPYQKQSIKSYLLCRYNIYRKCRQCGISTLTGAFALWYAMFFSNKKILIVSKRDDDAKEFLKKNVKFVYDHLPDTFKDIYGKDPPVYNEHTVGFPNGSVIRSLTSSPDTMRSESASLNIIDESGFMPHMSTMWSGAQPCCSYNTVVSTGCGLKRIDKLLEEAGNPDVKKYASQNIILPTDDGLQSSDAIWNNGYCKTIKIKTSLGYEFEATQRHRIRVVDADGEYIWKKLGDVQKGDLSCLMLNTCMGEPIDFVDPEPALVCLDGYKNENQIDVSCQKCYKSFTRKVVSLRRFRSDPGYYTCPSCVHHGDFDPPKRMTKELSEILGYYVGDGWLFETRPKRIKLCCDPNYKDLPQKLIDKLFSFGVFAYTELGNGTLDVRINNASFVDWLVRHKLKSKTDAFDAQIPASIFASGPDILSAFLRGLFEADGTITGGRISLSTSSSTLADQVRTSLLSLGILTHTFKTKAGGFENSMGGYIISVLDRRNCQLFQDKIGFLSDKKDSVILQNPKQENGLCIDHSLVEEFCNRALITVTDKKQKARLYGYKRTGRIPYQRALEINDSNTKLGRLLDKDLIFDKIVSIENDSTLTADISVPVNNTYIANGFVSHNTLIHGGSVIVISTTNGVGNWYHTTWDDAIGKRNEFNPIEIMWWDMDWAIKFNDEFTGKECRISPTDNIRKCETKEDKNKWGPYHSPWLEEQYRALQQKGEEHLFRQEVLAEFIGTGNTVLDREALLYVRSIVSEKYWTVGNVKYFHPVTEQQVDLDFEHQLQVWKKPQKPEPDIIENGRIIKPGDPGHTYSMGVDISSGEAADYSAIEIIDCNTKEQVAELNILVKPMILLMMMDYLGRWYNGAFIVPERTGLGIPVCQSLYHDIAYTNVYHMKTPAGKPSKKVGFPTNPTHKGSINKALIDHICEDGVYIYSERCLEQLMIYVHLGTTSSGQVRTGHVTGPGNHSDMSIAMGLALLGMKEAVQSDHSSLLPTRNLGQDFIQPDMSLATRRQNAEEMTNMLAQGGIKALVPIITGSIINTDILTPEEEIAKFTRSLGGVPIGSKAANPIYRQKSRPINGNV